MVEELFAQALHRGGPEYLTAEAALRAGGAPAVATLQGHLNDPNRLARLIARMLSAWVAGKAPDNQVALDDLDARAKRAAETPMGTPSPSGIAHVLGNSYGDRVVDVLAVRMLKDGDWPHWKVAGVLIYLGENHPEKVTPALARFVLQDRPQDLRAFAVEILAKIPDPERSACLREEQKRLAVHMESLPKDVAKLVTP